MKGGMRIRAMRRPFAMPINRPQPIPANTASAIDPVDFIKVAARQALIATLALALVWSFFTRPRETLVLLGTLALMGLANAQPLACIIALGVLGIAVVLAGRTRKRPDGRLLTGNGESH